MRTCIILIFLCLISILTAAQWDWVVSAGSSNLDRVWDLAIDTQGNVLVTGEFIDTLRIQDQSLIGWGLNDIFVAKFSPSGNLIWARIFGGTDGDIGIGIDVDATGSSYVTGYYATTAHFEDQDITSAGSWDIFIMKLDVNGNLVWVESEGGTTNDIGYGIATTPDGTSTVTGWFGDVMTFHDNSTLTSFGSSDILVMALDASGNVMWKHQAGTAEVEYGYKVDVDYFGNSYVTGVAGTGSNFDGVLAPGDGMFIASYNNQGQIGWVNSGINAGVNSIAVDDSAPMIELFGCVTGRITGTAFFDSHIVSSYDNTDDAYNCEFQLLTGSWLSPDISGGGGSDKGRACTYEQHPYFAGSFEQSADLFWFQVVSNGGSDSYTYSESGMGENWLLTAGGMNNDVITDIGVDSNGNVYVCGWYSGIANFGTNHTINSGNDYDLDMFIARIDPTLTSNADAVQPSLAQISTYPNPFSLSTTINIDVKQAQTAGLQIFNLKGQLVRQLGEFKQGIHEIQWDGTDSAGKVLSSGLYIAKLSTPGYVKSSKMVFVK